VQGVLGVGRVDAHAARGTDEKLVVGRGGEVAFLRIPPDERAGVVGFGVVARREGAVGGAVLASAADGRVERPVPDLVVLPSAEGGVGGIGLDGVERAACQSRGKALVLNLVGHAAADGGVKGGGLDGVPRPPARVPKSAATVLGDFAPETLVPPPPPMVAPTPPAATELAAEPPTRLGAPSGVVPGSEPSPLFSRRSARAPLTLNSSGWLSVVPRKCVPGVVPALPVRPQASEEPGGPAGPVAPRSASRLQAALPAAGTLPLLANVASQEAPLWDTASSTA
jgi:hypothetical protein